MKVVNLIGRLPVHKTKAYRWRPANSITSIAIHHSATATGSPQAFARYHVNSLNWPGIGYAYVVGKDGTVYKCNPATSITYHVGSSNNTALGICLIGDYDRQTPPDDQLRATAELVKSLRSAYPSIKEVKRHGDYAGYAWKSCPGRLFPWQSFKAMLG